MTAREKWGRVLIGAGLLVILAAVLHMTSATVGGRVSEFKDRRTYTEVKVAAQRAWPATLVLGLAGLGLTILGARVRSGAGRSGPG